MTAAKLIEALQVLPPDTPVWLYDNEWGVFSPVDVVPEEVCVVHIQPMRSSTGAPTRQFEGFRTHVGRDEDFLSPGRTEFRKMTLLVPALF